jgi:hypothetical protein
MIPFWQSHSPAQIALNAALDAVWCIGLVIGWCIALWQHFSRPAVFDAIDRAFAEADAARAADIALPYSELPKAPAKARKRSRGQSKKVATTA